MDILITERTDMTPLLGMDWMKQFKLTIGKVQLVEDNQSEREKVFNKFTDLFENFQKFASSNFFSMRRRNFK